MMSNARYKAEVGVLIRKLGSNTFVFKDMNTQNPYVLMAARTNRGNVYTLRIELAHFPNNVPSACITKTLYDKKGVPLNTTSGTMHTLASMNEMTKICHYGASSWLPSVSIYKVFVKCRLWLEMYELHLDNGYPIDYYLRHQF